MWLAIVTSFGPVFGYYGCMLTKGVCGKGDYDRDSMMEIVSRGFKEEFGMGF